MEVAASSLVVLELSAASREARPPPAEDGRVMGEGVGSPPKMEERRARALAAPWGVMSKGVGGLMRRDERERRQSHEVRRASTGEVTSKLVLEVLATRRRVRSPPSVDGGMASENIGVLPMMEERWAQALAACQ